MTSTTRAVKAAILLCASIPAVPGAFGQAVSQTPAASGQTTPAEQGQTAPKRRVYVGLRGRDFPLRSLSNMQSRTTLTTTTSPPPTRDWNFNTTSHSPSWGVGPIVELTLSPAWTVSAEVLYNKLEYTKVTSIYWGTDDPTTTTDERIKNFRNENTHAVLWDVPVMVHHRGLAPSGPLSKVFVAAGVTGRTVTSVKSSTLFTLQDASTNTSTAVATPSRRNLLGAVVGVGFRIVDDFNINWSPEIRYTRWAGNTFGSDSTLSPRNQLEVGMSFTF